MSVTARSLYVHVPFCAHRCGYCDFVTTSASPELHERYVDALKTELKQRRKTTGQHTSQHNRFDTIFIGGGTPTLLEPAALQTLLEWLRNEASSDAEITIECNPETVTPTLATMLVDGGVNRVSLGAQSFSDHVLQTLERRANPDTIREAVHQLRSAGVKRLSLDLIWGIPGQTMRDTEHDLEEALKLEPDHLSAYELEFKPGTKLTHRYGKDAAAQLIGEHGEDQYDLVIDRLEAAGWLWYETANFARTSDERCRHNLAYWQAKPWLAVGVGAVQNIAAERRTNLPNLPRYLRSLEQNEDPPHRVELIDSHTARCERIMLALRLCDPFEIERQDLDEGIVEPAAIERLAALKLARVEQIDSGYRIQLNRRGRMLQRSVADLLLNVAQ